MCCVRVCVRACVCGIEVSVSNIREKMQSNVAMQMYADNVENLDASSGVNGFFAGIVPENSQSTHVMGSYNIECLWMGSWKSIS